MKTVRLGDYADQIRGVSYKPHDLHEMLCDDSVILLRANNIDDNCLNFDEVVFVDKKRVSVAQYLLDGDIVICASSGSKNLVGKAGQAYALTDVTFGAFCKVVRPKNIVPRYLGHFFFSPQYRATISGLSEGVNINNIRNSDIDELELPLPDENAQQRIADVLDKAQTLISDRREQIAVLDKLAKDLFVDMFGDPIENSNGWDVKSLPEFYKGGKQAVKCGPFGSALKKDEYTETGVAVWTMDNITKLGEFVDNPYLRIPAAKYEQLASYGVMNGDVIISRAGTVGKMCVVDSVETDSIISTNLIRARFNEEMLLPQYFVSLILCYGARVARLRKGADNAFTHMNTGILDSIAFPWPPMELQLDYKRRFDKIVQQKATLIESLAILESIYKSILQQAFNGELFQ